MARTFVSLALGCALLFVSVALQVEEIRDYYAEPGLNPFKDSINQHFNEHIDPFSGTLQLKYKVPPTMHRTEIYAALSSGGRTSTTRLVPARR